MNLLNIYLLILTILLGLCVGSFLNVVIYRLPREMSLASPASPALAGRFFTTSTTWKALGFSVLADLSVF